MNKKSEGFVNNIHMENNVEDEDIVKNIGSPKLNIKQKR